MCVSVCVYVCMLGKEEIAIGQKNHCPKEACRGINV